MKKAITIILSIVGVLVLVGAGGLFYMTSGLESGENLAVNPVDLQKIEDGTYAGVYESGRWTNEVAVSVADHQIASIDVVKTVTMESPEMTSTIISRVIENQNTTVDTVSGATVTSKAYLKAIENALNQ
ncbi:FMN-binding protein [uncultured Acetobacterium sp.]|uniref:FMN-binding protein n=1 Tax=uncultured Acetobacterium sp. TaxID=217139 RepID=UPI0024270CCE|nr:FMN-binding protein [uncultured Acetobacterium sp.]MBU4539950.1 FMN-binding protein [Bacillota bacterium]MDP2843744.1 FMN-binding protein [Acetobacterium sp.]